MSDSSSISEPREASVSPKFEEAARRVAELLSRGSLDEAESGANLLAREYSNLERSWILLGSVYFKKKLLEKAADCFRQSFTLNPRNVESLNNLGVILNTLDRHKEAALCLQKALSINSEYTPAYLNLGNAFLKLRLWQKAAACYQTYLKSKPQDPIAIYRLGAVFKHLGNHQEALKRYHQLVQLQPQNTQAWNGLGVLYRDLKSPEKAIQCYRKAIEIDPNFYAALTNCGNLLRDLFQTEEAVSLNRRAVAIQPENPYIVNNLGLALKENGNLEESLTCFEKAHSLKPDNHITRLSVGVVNLLKGDFSKGWPLYEFRRLDQPQNYRKFDEAKEWKGEEIEGRSILVHEEQGLGDAFQFIRFLDTLVGRGAEVSFSVNPKLIRVLKSYSSKTSLISSKEGQGSAVNFDSHTYLMSLPYRLGLRLDEIPSQTNYLSAEPDLVDSWAERLGDGGYKIGINWKGNAKGDIDNGRSVGLDCFRPIAEVEGVRLISLRQDGDEEISRLESEMKVESFSREIDAGSDAFVDTAAIMKSMDLIVTTDTSIAHLAGALGVPVWVALKKVPDWRWGMEGDSSPWYPSMRLFRQKEIAQWKSVFEDMAATLEQEFSRLVSQYS